MHVQQINTVEEDGAEAVGDLVESVRGLGEGQALALAAAIALTLLTITLTGIAVRPLAALGLLVLVSLFAGWAIVARWRRLRASVARRREALEEEVVSLRAHLLRLDVERKALRAELAAERAARRESDRVARARKSDSGSSGSGSGSDRRLRSSSDSGRVAAAGRPVQQKASRLARAR